MNPQRGSHPVLETLLTVLIVAALFGSFFGACAAFHERVYGSWTCMVRRCVE